MGYARWLQNTLRIHRNMFWDHLTLPNIGNSLFQLQISTLGTTIGAQNLPLRPGVAQVTFGSWILASGSWILDSGSWIVNYELWIMNCELWLMIMIDDYDWWLWFMIMIYDYDWWLWFMIMIYDLAPALPTPLHPTPPHHHPTPTTPHP